MNNIRRQIMRKKTNKIKRERYSYFHVSYNFSGVRRAGGAILDTDHALGGCASSYVRLKIAACGELSRSDIDEFVEKIKRAEKYEAVVITNITKITRKYVGNWPSNYKEAE